MFKKIFILTGLIIISQSIGAADTSFMHRLRHEDKKRNEEVSKKNITFKVTDPNFTEGTLKLSFTKKNPLLPVIQEEFELKSNSEITISPNKDETKFLAIEVRSDGKHASYGTDISTLQNDSIFSIEFSKYIPGKLEIKPVYETLVGDNPYKDIGS